MKNSKLCVKGYGVNSDIIMDIYIGLNWSLLIKMEQKPVSCIKHNQETDDVVYATVSIKSLQIQLGYHGGNKVDIRYDAFFCLFLLCNKMSLAMILFTRAFPASCSHLFVQVQLRCHFIFALCHETGPSFRTRLS